MTSTRARRFDFTETQPPVEELGAVHFIAIGGSGVSGVARLMVQLGVTVTGSDALESATTRELAAAGARVWIGHSADHVGDVQTVVISGAVRESNPELLEARRRGLRVLHRAQAIAAVFAGHEHRRVAVAGSNGKTTTSAMLTTALQSAGLDPSYILGAAISGQSSASLASGNAAVIEADESDGSFLTYRPYVAIVTNIVADHLDFWGDVKAIEAAFEEFAESILPGGLLVACADDPGALRLAQRRRAAGDRVITYGTSAAADVQVHSVVVTGLESRAELRSRPAAPASGQQPERPDRPVSLSVPIPGEHNVLDAAAAFLAATEGLGAGGVETMAGLATYPGTHRRFELRGERGGVRVIDDYAHNPDKVAAVVSAGCAVRERGQRLVVVFQPHMYSRTRDFAHQFAQALSPADLVVVLDVFGAREDPIDGVSGELIVHELKQGADAETEVNYVPQLKHAAEHLAQLVRPGDVVLTVGAGDVTGLGPELLTLLGDADEHL